MIILYLSTLLLLGIYSYSQIDLNLTLFQNSLFLYFQQLMIQLGYFNRPLSTIFYLVLIGLLTVFCFLLTKHPVRDTRFLILGICLAGLLSYPAFSHDIFNYMFDAKILTFYHQNPYFFKALDFPSDTWLRFMHWVHRTYPYGPVWLAATAPLSILGFGKFTLTLFNFKIFFIATYLVNIWLVKKISPKSYLLFALNPLVVIESVISPHIDSFMTTFFLLSLLFWRQKIKSWIFLVLSVGTKFVTAVLTPLYFLKAFSFRWAIILLVGVTSVIILMRGPYPWYFLPIIALAAIFGNRLLCLTLSLGGLLTYAPYLFTGFYPVEVVSWQYALLVLPNLALLWKFLPKETIK